VPLSLPLFPRWRARQMGYKKREAQTAAEKEAADKAAAAAKEATGGETMETEPGELPPPASGEAARAADAAAAAPTEAKAPDTPMPEPPLPDDPIEDELRTLVPMVPHILPNPMPSLRYVCADQMSIAVANAPAHLPVARETISIVAVWLARRTM